MDTNFLKKYVNDTIIELLREQSEEKAKDTKEDKPDDKKPASTPGDIKIASGAVGRGRFRKFVSEAGARSKKDPKGLMKDLGIKKAQGASDIEKIMSVLTSAVNFHPTMREAYAGVSQKRENIPTQGQVNGVAINLASIDARNGMKFILHTLHAAKNAGLLSLEGAIEIGKSSKFPIFVYSL